MIENQYVDISFCQCFQGLFYQNGADTVAVEEDEEEFMDSSITVYHIKCTRFETFRTIAVVRTEICRSMAYRPVI